MKPAAAPVADSTGNWVDRSAPAWAQPYLRLARIDRPIGWWLLLLPCWWSTAMAALAQRAPWPDFKLLVLFLIGAIFDSGKNFIRKAISLISHRNVKPRNINQRQEFADRFSGQPENLYLASSAFLNTATTLFLDRKESLLSLIE